MGIEIFVERDSPQDEIEKAFQAISFGYRTAVFDYFREQRFSSIAELARKAGCQYPVIVEKFIREGKVALTGKDLDNLIDLVGKGKWLNQIKHVQIHVLVNSFEPHTYPDRPHPSEVIPKETDLAIREALAKISWFYEESTNRFLKQNPES